MASATQRKLSDILSSRTLPHRFLAAQLRRPTGRFGRWVVTRALDLGNAALVQATVDALALRADDTFLDLGFGGGLGLRLAAQRTRAPLFGVDFSPDVVVAGQRRLRALIASGRLNLLCADVAALPLCDQLVNAVCTTNTIYFWPDPERALDGLRRVSAPGGRIALGYSGAAKMSRFDGITRHGFRLYESAQVEPLLQAAGLRDIQTRALSGGRSEGDYVTVGVV
jgi:ubiquinone/menaquinone biosynthesis C-methylase UbiE